jgi:hypothetical protein
VQVVAPFGQRKLDRKQFLLVRWPIELVLAKLLRVESDRHDKRLREVGQS